MPFTLPNPNSPTNGDAGNGDPLRQNFQAIATAIQSFDGTQVQAATIAEAALANGINPRLRDSEAFFPFVQTGCVWSLVSGLNGTMSAGTVYINGFRQTVSSVGSRTFTVSKDTYVAVDNLGNITYNEVGNNTASPTLPANSIWLAIVTTSGAAITNVNLGQENQVIPIISSVALSVTDSNGNLICPRDPNRKVLGYRQIVATLTNISTNNTATQVTGLSCPVIVPTGRKVTVKSFLGEITNSAATTPVASVWDGVVNSGTLLGSSANTLSAGSFFGTNIPEATITPASASKTYNTGIRNTAAANVTINASSTAPAFIRVELA